MLRPYVTLLTPVLGFLVYATSSGGYDAFFAQFHVSPDEVGLGQATIVGRAAVQLGLTLFILIAILAASAALFMVIDRAATIIARQVGNASVDKGVLGVIVAVIALILRTPVRDLVAGSVVRIGLGTILIAWLRDPLWYFALLVSLEIMTLSIRNLRSSSPTSSGQLWRFVLVIGTIAFFFVAHRDFLAEGRIDAICAQADQVSSTKHPAGLQPGSALLSISADTVRVTWLGSHSPVSHSDTFLLLGQGNTFAVLYDLQRQSPVRIPLARMALTGAPSVPTSDLPSSAVSYASASKCTPLS